MNMRMYCMSRRKVKIQAGFEGRALGERLEKSKETGWEEKIVLDTIFCFQIFVVLVENYEYTETLIFSQEFIE